MTYFKTLLSSQITKMGTPKRRIVSPIKASAVINISIVVPSLSYRKAELVSIFTLVHWASHFHMGLHPFWRSNSASRRPEWG